jgi:Second Messenger Oligonucleotide or Dinucleotide Synthetase domain
MAVASAFSPIQDFTAALDELLLEVCEDFQLAPNRYDLAVARYDNLNRLLEGGESPFRYFQPEIYPQGSMVLGTTVKPTEGPHDLDFVLQLSRDHNGVDPVALIKALYGFLRRHGTYGPMTSLKNRCVRVEYADEFYMDVLPACRNAAAGGSCIKVPDRALKGWTDSNPLGYIDWFKRKSRKLLVERLLEKAAPVPAQQAAAEKKALQLVVQLMKRRRDLYYADDPDLAPISIVLTTLAADVYTGEPSVSKALTSVLDSIVQRIEASRRCGEKHLRLCNPSNVAEDLTERWDSNQPAYEAFVEGILEFHQRWSQLIARGGNVNSELEALFGETVARVLKTRAKRLQESRVAGRLGVTSSGIITSACAGAVSMRPNTFYGAE